MAPDLCRPKGRAPYRGAVGAVAGDEPPEPSGRRGVPAGLPRTALAIAVASWLLGVSALVLQLTSGVDVLLGDLLFVVVDAMVALVYGSVGAIILSRRRHVVGWLVALAGIGGGLAALGGGWRSFASTHPGLPPLEPLAAAYGLAWVPGTIGLFVLVPWFVRDHPLSVGAWLGVAGGAGSILFFLLAPVDDPRPAILGVVVMGLVTAAATWWRHRHGPPEERRGLGLLALGTAIMALSFLPLLGTWDAPDVILALPLAHLACQALFPAALLVSVLRNRLWGLDLALSRATIAALLTLALVAVYVTLVVAVTALVGSRPLAQVLAAVGVVLAVQPARTWLQRRVRSLVYGETADPGRAVLRMGRQLGVAATAEELLHGLVASIGESLRLESVTLTSGGTPPRARTDVAPGAEVAAGGGPGAQGGTPPTVEASWGRPTGTHVTHVPVEHGGRVLGDLAVTPRAGERLDGRTRDALAQLVPVVAAGLALASGARDLEQAKDAVTRARLAERRLVRRELHDGVGPWLSGLRLGLQGARNTLATDPAAAAAVLEALQREVEQRVGDVRTLSRSLLPPALDEAGLEAALHDLADHHDANGFAVEVLCGPWDDLDTRVAAAAYAIASEAVINASRHSGAAGCRVEVAAHPPGLPGTLDGWTHLVVTCDDAGSGVGQDARAGVGTRSMRERAEELGGTLDITSLAPRGTRVRAVLPRKVLL
ncbi:two-component sensor histidine kinase [Oerskovia turbata]|uniref:histidine kinase n=1 Tax=Oerskovia turbata TaxID=1713 RepID=A0A4Q1KV24_9CELL|nr:two-component sensor histidine kinase [Oerskovia turbata]RXR33992.1 two-component sensor histidine kinase [Oerskovia turbata]